jgi:hypothetical protein
MQSIGRINWEKCNAIRRTAIGKSAINQLGEMQCNQKKSIGRSAINQKNIDRDEINQTEEKATN